MTRSALALLALGGLWVGAAFARAQSRPIYDPQANAHQDIAAARAQASRTGRNIILIFGANW